MSAAVETVTIDVAKIQKARGPSDAPDSTGEAISSLTPELVIALCGPIGSPLHVVGQQFENALKGYGYATETIRLSKAISENSGVTGVVVKGKGRFEEIQSMIVAGDKLRLDHGNDVLAKFAIAKISGDREQIYSGSMGEAASGDAKISYQRVCHVIDSIKNKSELELLRLIYGDALIAVGVFSTLKVRFSNLQRSPDGVMSEDEIEKLVDVDSGEEFSHGQSVRDTFPRCDFFLRVDEPIYGATEPVAVGQIAQKINRLLGLVFELRLRRRLQKRQQCTPLPLQHEIPHVCPGKLARR